MHELVADVPKVSDTASRDALLKIGLESAMQATLDPVGCTPFSAPLAGCAQG